MIIWHKILLVIGFNFFFTNNNFFPFLWLHLNFFYFSQQCAREYWPFRSFCLLWNCLQLELFMSNFTYMMLSRFSWWLDLEKRKIVDTYHRKMHRYNCDDYIINGGDIFNFSTFGEKRKKKRKTSYRSFKTFDFSNGTKRSKTIRNMPFLEEI